MPTLFKLKKIDFKEAGLAIALIFGRYFFKSDNLHYGYWTEDLAVDVTNMARAQENYSAFLLSHVPEGTSTILDVGVAPAQFARRLLDLGYRVDCVSPSPVLTRHARSLLGEEQVIFESRYEDLHTEKRYDLVLFSESFQYINMDAALRRSAELLNEGGHVLVCDYFRKSADPSPLSGGQLLGGFYERLARYPYALQVDEDITEKVAPTLDVAEDFFACVVLPISQVAVELLRTNRPTLFKILQWVYREKIARMRSKYRSGARSGRAFMACKSYRLVLLQKRPG